MTRTPFVTRELRNPPEAVFNNNEPPPKVCPVCGCQVYDPFEGLTVIHNVARCIQSNNMKGYSK